jgi:hypothetical protein
MSELAFIGASEVRNVNIFRTLVRGFRYSFGDIHLVFRNILRRLRGDLVGIIAEVIVSTCNATLHSKCVYETILLHNTVAIQHSYNILLTYQLERSGLNLHRV